MTFLNWVKMHFFITGACIPTSLMCKKSILTRDVLRVETEGGRQGFGYRMSQFYRGCSGFPVTAVTAKYRDNTARIFETKFEFKSSWNVLIRCKTRLWHHRCRSAAVPRYHHVRCNFLVTGSSPSLPYFIFSFYIHIFGSRTLVLMVKRKIARGRTRTGDRNSSLLWRYHWSTRYDGTI